VGRAEGGGLGVGIVIFDEMKLGECGNDKLMD
jgi:hypothetical protein